MDNKGVVCRVQTGAFGEGLRDPVAYLMMNDPDLTAETEAQIRRMPGMVTVGWHRGHPERRKPDRRDWTMILPSLRSML